MHASLSHVRAPSYGCAAAAYYATLHNNRRQGPLHRRPRGGQAAPATRLQRGHHAQLLLLPAGGVAAAACLLKLLQTEGALLHAVPLDARACRLAGDCGSRVRRAYQSVNDSVTRHCVRTQPPAG